MPSYNYKNLETGETWTETRSMANRLDGVDGVRVVQMPSRPADTKTELHAKSRALGKFQRDTLGPICDNWRPDRTDGMQI